MSLRTYGRDVPRILVLLIIVYKYLSLWTCVSTRKSSVLFFLNKIETMKHIRIILKWNFAWSAACAADFDDLMCSLHAQGWGTVWYYTEQPQGRFLSFFVPFFRYFFNVKNTKQPTRFWSAELHSLNKQKIINTNNQTSSSSRQQPPGSPIGSRSREPPRLVHGSIDAYHH